MQNENRSMQIKEVLVVEGRNDTLAVQRAVQVETIETGGSTLHPLTLKQIELAQQRRGVIIFTDPDVPGERLRQRISQRVRGCKHAFLPQDKAKSADGRGKIGVEHASTEAIRLALQQVRTEKAEEGMPADIPWSLLVELGFVGRKYSRQLRRKVGNLLGIGDVNAKQFHKRLRTFCISRDELEQAYGLVESEVKGNE